MYICGRRASLRLLFLRHTGVVVELHVFVCVLLRHVYTKKCVSTLGIMLVFVGSKVKT